ncbi:MAG TPA: zinc-ribbon domain-containing protein, partial [Vicinamibacteria bacterium]
MTVQAQCPSCSTRIQIDDTKVPDRPFKVKCPKCQAVLTLPGRQAAAAAPPEAKAAPPPYEPPPPPSPAALARRERAEASANDAL